MDSDTEAQPLLSPKPLGQLGRDEMNLSEFPITLLTDRVPKNQQEAVYQDEIFDERTGRTLARKLTIKAGGYGLTTAADDEVILALIQLTRQKNNFTHRRVEFSRLELIRMLNWPSHGASYDRIFLSLQRWTSVYLEYDNAWRDNRTKAWTSPEGFHIIDNFKIHDSRSSGEQLDLLQSYIIWNEVIFESFQAGYLKPLDYDLCMALRNSTAKRMYRFLDKRFHHKPDWTFDLKEIAHMHIGLGRNYEGPAHLKRNLQPAINELEAIGFLTPLPDSERFLKNGKDWHIRLIQNNATPAPTRIPSPASEHETSPLMAELTKRGVTAKSAAELVQQHPAEAIQAKIDVFDWLVAKQDKRVAKSPEGYLVKSIHDGYKEPKGFVSAAEQQRITEAKRQSEQKTAADRRRKQEEVARERAELEAVAAYRKSRTPEQLTQLEAAAVAAASEGVRQSLNDATITSVKRTILSMAIDEHIRQILHDQQAG
jgi:hypothetical protein